MDTTTNTETTMQTTQIDIATCRRQYARYLAQSGMSAADFRAACERQIKVAYTYTYGADAQIDMATVSPRRWVQAAAVVCP